MGDHGPGGVIPRSAHKRLLRVFTGTKSPPGFASAPKSPPAAALSISVAWPYTHSLHRGRPMLFPTVPCAGPLYRQISDGLCATAGSSGFLSGFRIPLQALRPAGEYCLKLTENPVLRRQDGISLFLIRQGTVPESESPKSGAAAHTGNRALTNRASSPPGRCWPPPDICRIPSPIC